MKLRTLGIIAIVCAPFLAIDFYINGIGTSGGDEWSMGLCDMIYMTGWMCSIAGLVKLKATGSSFAAKAILVIQFALLVMAQLNNLTVISGVGSASMLFKITNPFWPLSNLFMIVTGIAVLVAKILSGWKRFITLAIGLWLPFSGLLMVIFGKEAIVKSFSGPYSAIMWALLGVAIYSSKEAHEAEPANTATETLQTA